MKYETPELTVLVPAINAIQVKKINQLPEDHPGVNDGPGAYEDWE